MLPVARGGSGSRTPDRPGLQGASSTSLTKTEAEAEAEAEAVAEAEAEAEAEAQGSRLRAQGSGLRAQGSGLIRIRAQESGLASSTCVRGALARWSTVGACGGKRAYAQGHRRLSRAHPAFGPRSGWAGASQCRETQGPREKARGDEGGSTNPSVEGPRCSFQCNDCGFNLGPGAVGGKIPEARCLT